MTQNIQVAYRLHRLTQEVLTDNKSWDEAMQEACIAARHRQLDAGKTCALDDCIAALAIDGVQLTNYLAILAAIYCNLIPVYQDIGNIQQARRCCENGLTLAARVHNKNTENVCYDNLGNLGVVYRQQGQPKEAIACFERVLVYKRGKGDRQAEGLWLGNLALAQRDLGQLEAAIDSVQRALELAQTLDDAEGIAITKNTLGVLHHEMGYLDTALQHYLAVLDMNRQVKDLQGECATLIHMGLAYRELRQLEVSLAHYELALERARSIKDQGAKERIENYAIGNRGMVQRELGQTQQAISSLKKALQSPVIAPLAKAIYLNILGLAYRDMGQIKLAIESFEQAQAINEQIGNPRGTARNMANLGGLYLRENRMADARLNLVQALRLSRKSQDWEDMWRLYWHLGEVVGYGYGHWRKALRYFECAISLLEGWRANLSLGLREQTMQDKVTIYQQAILAARRLGCFERALELIEQAKTRYLSDVLTHRDQRPTDVPKDLLNTYIEFQDELQRQLHAYSSILQFSSEKFPPSLDVNLTSEDQREYQQDIVERSQEIQKKLLKTRVDLDKAVDRIRTYNPDFRDSLYAKPMTFHQISDLIPPGEPTTALVEFVITREGTGVFIVMAGQEQLPPENFIWSDDFAEDDLERLILRRDASGNAMGGWLIDYAAYTEAQRVLRHVENQVDVTHKSDVYRRALEDFEAATARWRETLEHVTGELGQQFFTHIHPRLQKLGVKHLFFVSHQALHLLPLHALHWLDDGCRHYLLDDYDEITFVPSAFVLARCKVRAAQPQRRQGGLLLVADTLRDLPASEGELALLDTLFANRHHTRKCLLRDQGTRKAVTDNLPEYTHIHFACHGEYKWQNPLESCLYLYPPPGQEDCENAHAIPAESLTLREIRDTLDLSHVRLLTLSACETAITNPNDRADEYVGLPAGFLMAGVPAIVASLWTTNDLAAMLLMERFYDHYLDGMSLPGALRNAQRWLRDVTSSKLYDYFSAKLKCSDDGALSRMFRMARRDFDDGSNVRPFEHPFYWSCFTFSGS